MRIESNRNQGKPSRSPRLRGGDEGGAESSTETDTSSLLSGSFLVNQNYVIQSILGSVKRKQTSQSADQSTSSQTSLERAAQGLLQQERHEQHMRALQHQHPPKIVSEQTHPPTPPPPPPHPNKSAAAARTKNRTSLSPLPKIPLKFEEARHVDSPRVVRQHWRKQRLVASLNSNTKNSAADTAACDEKQGETDMIDHDEDEDEICITGADRDKPQSSARLHQDKENHHPQQQQQEDSLAYIVNWIKTWPWSAKSRLGCEIYSRDKLCHSSGTQ